MRSVKATRPGAAIGLPALLRSLLTGLIIALPASAAGRAGSAADRGRPTARTAGACDGSATLHVSDPHPRQLRSVRFSATGSSVPAKSVAFYDFDYGDGSDDASTQPTAVHAYPAPGTYVVEVSIVTACNTIVNSPPTRVVVRDGIPPTAVIALPRANQVAHFGPAGLLLAGSASDPSGVRRVELAIQLLSVKRRSAARSGPAGGHTAARRPVAQAGCYWYDGRITLRPRSCGTPLYFPVHLAGSRWAFRMNPRSQIPPGFYAVRVRATDRAGNTTNVFSPRLGNLLGFTLVA